MKDSAHHFPLKLHSLLDWESPEVVGWTRNGNAFRVYDIERFKDEVVPKYWRHTKITSFQRQLNLYGFKKILHGDDMGAYYHPLFVRGRTDLLRDFKRSAIKSSALQAELNYVNRLVESGREVAARLTQQNVHHHILPTTISTSPQPVHAPRQSVQTLMEPQTQQTRQRSLEAHTQNSTISEGSVKYSPMTGPGSKFMLHVYSSDYSSSNSDNEKYKSEGFWYTQSYDIKNESPLLQEIFCDDNSYENDGVFSDSDMSLRPCSENSASHEMEPDDSLYDAVVGLQSIHYGSVGIDNMECDNEKLYASSIGQKRPFSSSGGTHAYDPMTYDPQPLYARLKTFHD